jgi:DNA-binding NarL/FixJ family response regulator
MDILIIDPSLVFSIGLKSALLNSRLLKSEDVITIKSDFDFNIFNLPKVDVLFIDFDFLKNDKNIEIIKSLRNKNDGFKYLISSFTLHTIDLNNLLSIKPNGIFSKKIKPAEFRIYFKRVLTKKVYIDFVAINTQIKSEIDFNAQTTEKFKNANNAYILDYITFFNQ